jgi:transposase
MFIVEPLEGGRSLLTFYEKAAKKPVRMFSIQLGYEPDKLAKQFRISRQGRRFYLSGSYNDGVESATNEELLKGFVQQNISNEALLSQITGIDRGVKLPIATSDGLRKAYSPETTERLKRLAQKKARYQRILARKKRQNNNKNTKGIESKEQQKLADKIANFDAKTARIRHDFLHQTSKEVVLSAKPIIALEALTLKNMTRRAKPKRGAYGRGYARNNARAKSGLNRTLLNVALGKLGDFIKYKANDHGKAVVEVNPAGTSQTCHVCGKKNTIRPQQDTLICLNGCGAFHADDNASIVIAQRAVPYIQESTFAQKAKTHKKTAIRKKVVSPPLGNELASTEKSGELEAASTDVSLACASTQADVSPSSTASLVQRNSLTTMDTSQAGVLETR